jgi:hypothetical protein
MYQIFDNGGVFFVGVRQLIFQITAKINVRLIHFQRAAQFEYFSGRNFWRLLCRRWLCRQRKLDARSV